ncbi:ribose-phosphate pyrophosphokinase [mine drainage metagenome]|uniref:ribose-phosphate diphosphokinase n=1 Tax=mine drainage metagenome TaxID=410659 RepID=T1CJT5_9ZZZZ
MHMDKETVIAYDQSSADLAIGLSSKLGMPKEGMIEIKRTSFLDSEFKIQFSEEVRGRDVLLISRIYPGINDNIVALMFALKKLNDLGNSVSVAMPYLAYARQDREFLKGEAASIFVLADMLKHYGVKGLIVFDMHNTSIISSLGIKVRNITAIPYLAECIAKLGDTGNMFVISPDEGSKGRSEVFAKAIGAECTYLEKRRDRVTGEIDTKSKDIDLSGKDAIIFDDMIATGGSMANAAKIAKVNGAKRVIAVCTHALMLDSDRKKARGFRSRADNSYKHNKQPIRKG